MRELIGDMLEELTLDQVFAKLGDPAVFAVSTGKIRIMSSVLSIMTIISG